MTQQFNIRPSANGVKIPFSEQKDAQKQFESKIPVQVASLGGVLGAGALLVEEGAIAAFVVAELPAIIIALGAMVVGYGLWQLVKILTNPTPQQASNLLNDAHLKSKMPTKIQEHLILHAEGGKSKATAIKSKDDKAEAKAKKRADQKAKNRAKIKADIQNGRKTLQKTLEQLKGKAESIEKRLHNIRDAYKRRGADPSKMSKDEQDAYKDIMNGLEDLQELARDVANGNILK